MDLYNDLVRAESDRQEAENDRIRQLIRHAEEDSVGAILTSRYYEQLINEHYDSYEWVTPDLHFQECVIHRRFSKMDNRPGHRRKIP